MSGRIMPSRITSSPVIGDPEKVKPSQTVNAQQSL
jgi:hypothetical protein